MGYVTKTLAPGEEFLYRAHFNWTYHAQSWFWFALGAAPGLAWLFAMAFKGGAAPALGVAYAGLSILAFFIGALIFIVRFVHHRTTVIAVTSERLIMKTGMIARQTHEVTLDKIEEVLMDQPFLGRILGFGVITIRGTGIAVINFPVLGQPVEIRRELERAIVRARERRAPNHQQKEG